MENYCKVIKNINTLQLIPDCCRVNERNNVNFADVMEKHAYLILAHANPWQLRMLLSSLDHVDNEIYVHLDSNAPFGYEALEGVSTCSEVHFINPRISIHWGGVSIVRAEMALLEEAVKKPHSYYHLLSGMDLPIKSQDEIHRFFDENAGKEFINMWEMESHTLKRVQYFTLFPEGSLHFLTNLLNHAFKGILSLLHIRQNRGITFCKGSQWFSITDSLAKYIVSQKEWVEKVFRHTTLCDEILVPTLINKGGFGDRLYCSDTVSNRTVNDSNMRLVDWSRGPSVRHPWIFTINDLEMLRNAPHLWARKFDENTDREIISEVCRMTKTEL